MPMDNLLEYNWYYFDNTSNLSFYFKDEAKTFDANTENTDAFRSFKYKAITRRNSCSNKNNGILKNSIVQLWHFKITWNTTE